ncbi:DUF5686 family protein [Bacteroides sp.]|uniref:DUF5686 family protein n=1 Tax=Bacteroides sp. TaxID=29523 RepID=UPI0025BD7562|nr:DUF5686 family protein [Bacteroides sp.]
MTFVMNFAPFYEKIVQEYHAKLYIKGKLYIKKKNVMFRYLPTLFRLKKGVREYIAESSSDLHYTAPRIYDQKVKAIMGTLPGSGRFEREMLEYFNVNIYSSTLLNDRLMSPLAKNGKKYYRYQLDSIIGEPDNLRYKIRFIPKSKSDQLVGGYMIVNANVWSVREIRFSGRSKLILFENFIKMGNVGEENEFLPTCYEFKMHFIFMGNVIDGSYLASLNYNSIRLQEKKKHLREKKNYNLTESYTLVCDTNSFHTDSVYFDSIRPVPLTPVEKSLYKDHALRRDTLTVRPISKGRVFWGEIGDFLISDYNVNLSWMGNVRFSPIINPLLFSFGGSNGMSYRQDFKYNRLFSGDKLLRIIPRVGYNFTRKEFYWSVNTDFDYWPQKRAALHMNFGNGNRIYSSDVLDELKALPDSLFDFDQIHLDYFSDLFFNVRHSIELLNGLELSVGFSAHRRTPVQSSKLVPIKPEEPLPPDAMDKFKKAYISFAPRMRVEWTPGMYYYMNGKRKVNLRSNYPTFSVDWERGIKGVFKSTGQYERVELDLQHKIHLGLMRNIYYRFGTGAFTNSDELYFVDFNNFSRNNLPVGWNDEIGGVFQLLDGRWYNSSRNYVRAHFTYEAPFLLIPHLMKYTRYVQNERLYISALRVPHLNPYLEIGYGIGTHIFDFGVFVGTENFKYSKIGCKFTFELFNR